MPAPAVLTGGSIAGAVGGAAVGGVFGNPVHPNNTKQAMARQRFGSKGIDTVVPFYAISIFFAAFDYHIASCRAGAKQSG